MLTAMLHQTSTRSLVLNRRGSPPQEGVNKFQVGREPLCALQHEKFDQ